MIDLPLANTGVILHSFCLQIVDKNIETSKHVNYNSNKYFQTRKCHYSIYVYIGSNLYIEWINISKYQRHCRTTFSQTSKYNVGFGHVIRRIQVIQKYIRIDIEYISIQHFRLVPTSIRRPMLTSSPYTLSIVFTTNSIGEAIYIILSHNDTRNRLIQTSYWSLDNPIFLFGASEDGYLYYLW